MAYVLQLLKMATLGAIVGMTLTIWVSPFAAALVALVVVYLLLVRVS